ncbi:hypothetical protein BGW36DRAFT_367118 [Talaromyces proteolyticus]|uniref:Uncharacterized protein n=1 Tax=Talaromyces proteolyticus TaxID=1131652 RepID=A0AAD4Q632_9EURO|nr:uncharacterized protein BGW36DRAFT_367118 [Talaromyces proteolyticus]KAH8705223.1 hypothetical protein BGW36DRAFT_367118 [Talaromyces proteolyticus]
MSTTRYTIPVPEGIPIIATLEEVDKIVRDNPTVCLYDEDNGYYLKDDAGTAVAVASDELCEEFDKRMEDLNQKIASGELSD